MSWIPTANKFLVLLDVGYVLDNVDPPFQGEKRVVFLVILAVVRMVIWLTRNKGLYFIERMRNDWTMNLGDKCDELGLHWKLSFTPFPSPPIFWGPVLTGKNLFICKFSEIKGQQIPASDNAFENIDHHVM